MSSAITDHVKKVTNDLITDPGKVFLDPRYHADPGGFFDTPDASATMSAEDIESELTVFEEAQAETAAADAATQTKKKKKEVTQTVLTSPLGATETARTAVTKLGGR